MCIRRGKNGLPQKSPSDPIWVGWLSMFSHPIPETIERIIIMKMGAAKRVYRETKPTQKGAASGIEI